MNRILNIWLLTFIFLTPMTAQYVDTDNRSRILFQGIVRDASSLSPLANSQIFINRSFITASDSAGTFSLLINRRDTLEISLLGYKSAVFFVNDSLPGKEFMAGIYLNTDTITIGEVIIVPRLANLRSEILNAPRRVSPEFENAKNNLALSAYQAKVSQGKLGDPSTNYEMLRQQQRTEAYEKGQIPSSRITGISPLLLVPAIYLMMNGFPQKPAPMKSDLNEEEINQIQKKYLESIKKKE
jgi:hypothetical protein